MTNTLDRVLIREDRAHGTEYVFCGPNRETDQHLLYIVYAWYKNPSNSKQITQAPHCSNKYILVYKRWIVQIRAEIRGNIELL